MFAWLVLWKLLCGLSSYEQEGYGKFLSTANYKTGQYFYWEYFGWLDKSDYLKNMHTKLQLYTSNSFFPGINLITTYETKDQPLTFEMVEMMIKYYFL